ncbi:MAG: hypothetical protein U1F43_08785 [Myxococcota bacterium]
MNHAFFASALALSIVTVAGCGSSSGAKKPDECPVCKPCDACPPPPRPGPAPIVIGEDALPHDRSRSFELVALAADGKSALVRLEDEQAGDFYQQLDLTGPALPKPIKFWPYQAFTEPTTKKQAMKAVKPEAPWPPSQRTAGGLVALAADEADHIALYVMKDERAVLVARIARLKDEAGAPADVAVIKLAWDPSGTRLVVIHRQTLLAAPGFTTDFVHVITIDPKTLPFD